MRGLLLVVLACLAAALAVPSTARAADFGRCPPSQSDAFSFLEEDFVLDELGLADLAVTCTRVAVPLDRSGQIPGNISLAVERARLGNKKRTAPPIVALAGGPGQSATAFTEEFAASLRPALRSRDLIVFDQRGTGESGLLRCPSLERVNLLEPGEAVARCAEHLGPTRSYYTTSHSVDDIEAVRRELGVEKISLFGVSYGTKVALGYAARYPAHVDRLVLDSVLEPEGPDPFYLDAFQSTPRVLRLACGGACKDITRSPSADLTRLVARLRDRPLRGTVINDRGRPRPATLDQADLFTILLAGDFDPTLRAEFPAAVKSALRGDEAPILRLARRAIEQEGEPSPPYELSAAAYAATTCEETPLPWERTATLEQRRAAAAEAVARLPESVFGPFDRKTALASDVLALCERWPGLPGAPEPITGPLPRVPTLILEGAEDLRTPTVAARRIRARLPTTRLVVVPGGHSALSNFGATCAERALRQFFANRPLRSGCGRPRRLISPTPLAPRSLADVPRARGIRGGPSRVATASALTLGDVGRNLLPLLSEAFDGPGDLSPSAGGLRGGRFTLNLEEGAVDLDRVEYVPGVKVSGTLVPASVEGERSARARRREVIARLEVATSRWRGKLTLRRSGVIAGRMGGRRVRGRVPLGRVFDEVGAALLLGKSFPEPGDGASAGVAARSAELELSAPVEEWERAAAVAPASARR